VSANIIQF